MTSKRTADKQHRWLSQVEVTGVVFSEPVLAEAAPAGFPNLDKKVLAQFHKAREIWNLPKGMVREDPQAAWVRFILEEILRHRPTDWLVGAAVPADNVVNLPAQQETIRPTRVLVDGDTAVLLMLEVPRAQSLDRPWMQGNGRWKASPTTKLERLLRETGVELGLVTNGEAWRLVAASPAETASWITWTATTWAESPLTLAAFRDLLGSERFFAGSLEGVPLELIRRSRERQLDVADQLGEQAREVLTAVVHALDEVDESVCGALLRNYTDDEVFDSGVAFVMRLLFLFFAEENLLLPHGTVAYDRAYGILHLLTELEHRHRLSPERLTDSYSAYARLLATFRLVYEGSVDSDIQVPAHGGHLFDPDAYPLLEGRSRDGDWLLEPPSPPKLSDNIVREILRSLKYARVAGVRQVVSYRTLAVEQIGHMYEGLLELQAARAPDDCGLFLLEPTAKAAEPLLSQLEVDGCTSEDEVIDLIARVTGRTKVQVQRIVARQRQRDPDRMVGGLGPAAQPLAHFLRQNGVIHAGRLYLRRSTQRGDLGTHYTPPSVTGPLVEETLRPLLTVASGEAAEPREILSLKICDPAMGSGAFLVQAVRIMGDALVDAWELQAAKLPDQALTAPYGEPSDARPEEALLPESREEQTIWARRIVAERCVYGVDLNHHAVEMAKLSLWLCTASEGMPFTFLDHALRVGDSLFGLAISQISSFSWQPEAPLGPLFAHADRMLEQSVGARLDLVSSAYHAVGGKNESLRVAEAATARLQRAGNLILYAFLLSDNQRDRERRRQRFRSIVDDPDKVASEVADAQLQLERIGEPGPVGFHWEVEFPEVFRRDNPGFDGVIGNPPYGATVSPRKLELASLSYATLEYQSNAYSLFYERGLSLVRDGGRLGFITPSTFAYQRYFAKLRDLIKRFPPTAITLYKIPVFRGVEVGDTVAWVLEKRARANSDRVCLRVVDETTGLISPQESTLETGKILDGPEFRLSSDPSILASISGDFVALGKIAAITAGIKPYQTGKGKPKQTREVVKAKPFTADEKVDDSYKLCFVGKNFRRYRIVRPPGMYLAYGEWLAEPRPKAPFFDSQKIILRQTADSLIGFLDRSRAVNLNNVYNVGPSSGGFRLEYILALLNSEVLNDIYQELVQEQGRVFPEVKKTFLARLPIARAAVATQDEISGMVVRVQALYEAGQVAEAESLVREIDVAVRQLYGLA